VILALDWEALRRLPTSYLGQLAWALIAYNHGPEKLFGRYQGIDPMRYAVGCHAHISQTR